jgi:hypothetical protein
MRRAQAWTAGALAVLAAAAPPVGARGAPDANLVAARAAAQRILSATLLPLGAVAQSTDPSVGGSLGQVYQPRGADQVIRTQYWVVSAPPDSVNAYIYRHPPAGSRFYSGSGPPAPSATGWQEERSFRGQTGRLTSELLEITTAPAPGGATAIRADAIVLWRPTWEEIPAGARAARVQLDGVAQRTVAGAGLARLRALVRTSAVVAPGPYACPAGVPGQAIRVTFVDAHGRPMAHIGADSADGCVWLAVTVGARRGPALQNGWALAPRLWAAGSLIRCTAGQLAVSVGAPSVDPSQATVTIRLHNLAGAPCSLKGFASIELLTATGRRLPVSARRAAGPSSVVTAAGHGTLSAGVSWRARPRRCTLPPPTSAIVGVPGIRHRFTVTLAPTRHRLGPCAGQVSISPLWW